MSNPALQQQINNLTNSVNSHRKFQNDLSEKIKADDTFLQRMIDEGKNQMQMIYDSEAEDFDFVDNPNGNGQISIQPYDLVNGIDNCNKYLDKEINSLGRAIDALRHNQ